METISFETPQPHISGYVVINSDDGKEVDYLDWFRVIKRAAQKYNAWYPYYGSAFSPAVNPGYLFTNDGIDRRGDKVMTADQLRRVHNSQGEILSHGYQHVYLDYMDVAQPVSTGDNTIHYNFGWRGVIEGYKYTIEEGDVSEEFTISLVSESQYLETVAPLVNSYSTNAKIHISEESARQDFENVINTLDSFGIECKHHVNAWYLSSAKAREWQKDYFESVVTEQIEDSRPQPIGDIDLYDIKRTQDTGNLSIGKLTDILEETKLLNTVLFIQGHGYSADGRLDKLEHIVEQCYLRGLRLISHSEAVEIIKKRQSVQS